MVLSEIAIMSGIPTGVNDGGRYVSFNNPEN
jgi:hypothetical protein